MLAETNGLRMLELVVPEHVARGQNIRLECNFNLDGETLYSVKWYKDGNEFYRYVPQDKPPVLVFPLPGVTANVRTVSFFSFSVSPPPLFFLPSISYLPYLHFSSLASVMKSRCPPSE